MRSYNSNAFLRRTSREQRVPSLVDWGNPFALLDNTGAFFDVPFSTSVFQQMHRVQDQMDRLIAQAFGGEQGTNSLIPSITRSLPRVDISETNRDYRIDLELPGIPQDAIDIQVIEGMLTIRAETKDESSNQNNPSKAGLRQYHYRERYWGSFERTFHLPPNADEDAVRAEFKDGVLSVSVPKKEPQQLEDRGGRRIAISASSNEPQNAAPKALKSANDS